MIASPPETPSPGVLPPSLGHAAGKSRSATLLSASAATAALFAHFFQHKKTDKRACDKVGSLHSTRCSACACTEVGASQKQPPVESSPDITGSTLFRRDIKPGPSQRVSAEASTTKCSTQLMDSEACQWSLGRKSHIAHG